MVVDVVLFKHRPLGYDLAVFFQHAEGNHYVDGVVDSAL